MAGSCECDGLHHRKIRNQKDTETRPISQNAEQTPMTAIERKISGKIDEEIERDHTPPRDERDEELLPEVSILCFAHGSCFLELELT